MKTKMHPQGHKAAGTRNLWAWLLFMPILSIAPSLRLMAHEHAPSATPTAKIVHRSCSDLPGILHRISLNGEEVEYPEPSRMKAPDGDTRETKEIEVNVNYDESIYWFQGASIKDAEGSFYSFGGKGSKTLHHASSITKTMTIDMPSGVYDILFSFQNQQSRQHAFIVKENVDFNTVETLDVDMAEASNNVHFTMRLPNGEIITPQIARIINENGEEEIVREGNISDYRDMIDFICIGDNINKCHSTFHHSVIPYDYEESAFSAGFSTETASRTFLINDVSSNVSICHYESFFVNGQMTMAEAIWHGGDPLEVDNINTPYAAYDFDFITTPYYDTVTRPEGVPYDPYRDYNLRYQLRGMGLGSGWQGSLEDIRHINISKMSNSAENEMYVYLENNEYGTYNPNRERWTYYPLTSPSLFLSDNHEFINGYFYLGYSRNVNYQFPDFYSNPFAYPANETDLKYGEPAPFWRIRGLDWPVMEFNSIGILGEERKIDMLNTEVLQVSLNGIDKTEEASLNDMGRMPLYASLASPGQKWDISIRNNNVRVENLPGYCSIDLNFETKEIPELPVLQQIQYRNSDGLLTNKFKDSSDGSIILAIGNFSHHTDPETFNDWFECGAEVPEIRMEVAPYNSEDWTEITGETDPDKFFLPCMGHYHSASLAEVTSHSSTHWYDLRVTLTSANGDTQTQTISPAFRIETPSSVNSEKDSYRFRIEGNNIIGDEDMKILSLSGYQVKGNNLAAGVYLVTTGHKTYKVIIQ